MQQQSDLLNGASNGRRAKEACAAEFLATDQNFVAVSTRPDFLPPAFVEALATLQEKARPVSIEEIRATIMRELGKSVDDALATFDTVPVAAASLVQMHRATLQNGTAVAIKIQRPHLGT